MAKFGNYQSFKKESPESKKLRDVAESLGIKGAKGQTFDDFVSNATTKERNDAMKSLEGFGPEALIRKSPEALQREVADRLRVSGPATFRDIRDALGAGTLGTLQEQFGLNNIPESILPTQSKIKPGRQITISGTNGEGDLLGFRKTLEESLSPEAPAEAARRDIIKKRKQEELQDSVEQQLDEQIAAQSRGQQQPNIIQRVANQLQGVGSNFLDRLSTATPAVSQAAPLTQLNIPETGETLDFDQGDFLGNVNPTIRKLEDDALLAISNGADPLKVRERLAQMINQTQSNTKSKENKGAK